MEWIFIWLPHNIVYDISQLVAYIFIVQLKDTMFLFVLFSMYVRANINKFVYFTNTII